jgi:predicted outer membrane repeat protein
VYKRQRYLCGAVIVAERASLHVSGCLFANNSGVTEGAYEARGGAISILAASAGGFSVANTMFSGNQAVRTAGYNTAGGGAISVDQPWLMVNLPVGPMTITNCTFVGNSAHNGGALDGTLSFGLLTVSQSRFTQNVANTIPFQNTGYGGAVKLGSHFGDRPFQGASSDHGTNAMFEKHAHYVFDTCSFTGNKAVVQIKTAGVLVPKGGAIAVLQGGHGLTVTNSVFTNNSAGQGGALYQNGVSLMNLNFLNTINPTAAAAAAAVNTHGLGSDYFEYAPQQDYVSLAPVGLASSYLITLAGCNFTGNTAVTCLDAAIGGRGGALFINCGLTYAVSSSFIGNAATVTPGYTSYGGAVAVTDNCKSIDFITFLDSNFTCSNCLFDSNTAVNGGGAVATLSAVGAQTRAMVLSFQGGTMRNQAAAQGGAVYLSGADANVSFSGVTLSSNTASVSGGAVYTAGSVTVANCTLSGNAAGNGSAVAVASGGSLVFGTSTVVSGNTAVQYGTTFVAAQSGAVSFAASASFSANTAQAGGIVFYDTISASSLAALTSGLKQATGNYGPVSATVPSTAVLFVKGVAVSPPVGAPAYVAVQSNTAVNMTFTLADAFGQAVQFWKDAAFDVACSSFRGATAASAIACPAGTVGGATHASYFSGVASLQPLVAGAIGASVLLTATLQSPTVPALLPPGLVYSINVTVLPCSALQTFDTPSLRCVCAAGAYFNGDTGACTACAPGSYMPLPGTTSCLPCSSNSYQPAFGATSCMRCPDMAATSPPSSSALLNCSCPYGTFASYDANITTFACLPCPVGALCSGALAPSGPTAPPLPLERYLHAVKYTLAFYDCDDGMCLAEKLGVWPNCREGHTGLVCAECIPEWRIVEGFCESCVNQESLARWPAAKREALATCLGVIVVLIAVPFIWWPLFLNIVAEWKQRLRRWAARLRGSAEPEQEKDAVDDHVDANHKAPGTFALALGLVSFFMEPLELVTESLQIVSSFKSTTRVPWPITFRRYVGRLSIVNFNFLHLPKSACATPETDLYSEFDGITLSITAILLFIALVWALGLALNLLVLRRGPDVVGDYNRRILAQVLLVMQLAYAPLAETIIGVFSCRQIAGSFWLTKESKLQCYVPLHNKYRALGAFWATVYVAGIPAAFLAVLHYYRIPAAAAHLRQVALLRQTVDTAWQRGVKQPENVNTSKVTPSNISAEHVDDLYFGLIHGREAPTKAELASGVDASTGALIPQTPLDDVFTHNIGAGTNLDDLHKKRFYAVMRWGRKNVHLMHYTWHEVQEEEDLRRPGAEEACGELFEHFYPTRWYYKLFETAVKLVLTSVLLFIAPGSAAQILAGVLITFLVLIVYLRLLPYSVKAVRRIAYACNLVIFLLMLLALGLKANVGVGNSDHTDLFYSVCVGIVIYTLLAAPVLITLNSGVMMYVKHNVKHSMHKGLRMPPSKKSKHLNLIGGHPAGKQLESDHHDIRLAPEETTAV